MRLGGPRVEFGFSILILICGSVLAGMLMATMFYEDNSWALLLFPVWFGWISVRRLRGWGFVALAVYIGTFWAIIFT
ncbi:MAG: hypothetical protein ACXAC5_01615 [Promethearchaeota archaeon]